MHRNPRTHARPLVRLVLAAALSAPLFAGAAAAADAAPPASGNEAVSPQARAVLERMTTALRNLPTFSVDGRISRDGVVSYGYKLQHQERASLTVQRPDKLRAEISGDLRRRSFVFDGKSLVMYSPDDAAYVRTAAPATIATLLDTLFDAGIDLPMIDVLYQGANGNLADAARGGVLVGESTVEGVACDQLAFRQASVDWQIWVEKGERALPRKIVITTRYEVGEPQFQVLLDWNLKPRIDASTFSFTAPKGATEIPFASPADAGAQP